MANYKAIKGYVIQTVDGDPSNLALGQVWYNSSAKKVKVGKTQAAGWTASTALPRVNNNNAVYGTPTATHHIGGYPATNDTQIFDGSSWTEVNNLTRSPTTYSMRGTGTTTAGVIWGGVPPVVGKTEEFDGTNWTESGDLNTARYGTMGTGTQTAA